MDTLSGIRKLLICLFCIVLSTSLLVFKIITSDQWVEINKFVIPAFMAANLAERWINMKGQDV